jgi:preprotein translocase subunit SecF
MIDIIGKKWLYFIFSGLIIVPGIISLLLWGLKPSIDFTGGSLVEVEIINPKDVTNKDALKAVLIGAGIPVSVVVPSGQNTYLMRLKPIDQSENQKLVTTLTKSFGDVKEVRYETVGPSVGKETEQNAIRGVIVASIAIVLYIAWAFRSIPKPYSSILFGLSAVIALLHDILVVMGVFSLLGHFRGVEVDSLFITALLTVMGFSVHDTIVVFDRIRENLRKMPGVPFARVVNESMVETLGRSLSTSLTVLLTLFALFLFGGESIHWFIVTLLVGVASGTYSSIFNAAPILVVWEEWSVRRQKRG